jgi:DNA-binding MarR family transcriptional regulator
MRPFAPPEDLVWRFAFGESPVQLEELHNFWTQVLGAPGPQWMIVMALQRLDRSDGASVQAIAETLQVNPTFVTSQARFLESRGLIRLQARCEESGAVSLSLTEKSRQRLAELALLQQKS